MLAPRFRVEESWDGCGDVYIWFDDASLDLRERVCAKLNEMIPRLHKHAKSIYHVDELIGYIFYKMSGSGNLQINSKTKQWVWAEQSQNIQR